MWAGTHFGSLGPGAAKLEGFEKTLFQIAISQRPLPAAKVSCNFRVRLQVSRGALSRGRPPLPPSVLTSRSLYDSS